VHFLAFFAAHAVIARSEADEAIQNGAMNWIASSQELLAMTAPPPVTVNNLPTQRGVYQFKTTSRIVQVSVTNR
jgi:hypothetical protein